MQEQPAESVQENAGCLAALGRLLVSFTHQYVFLVILASWVFVWFAFLWWNTAHGLYALFALVPMFYFVGLALASGPSRLRTVAYLGSVFAFVALLASYGAYNDYESHQNFFLVTQVLELGAILLGVRRLDASAAPLVPTIFVPRFTNVPDVRPGLGAVVAGIIQRWLAWSTWLKVLSVIAAILNQWAVIVILGWLAFKTIKSLWFPAAAQAQPAAAQADTVEEAQPVPGVIRLPGPTPAPNGDRVPGLPQGTPGPDDYAI